jgi:putative membrane-bound dehydrogenase-like protein
MRWPLLLLVVTLSSSRAGVLPEGVTNTQQSADRPLSPQEALKRITVPSGFHVELFASEPDVLQPIAFDFDDRGRVWVAESFSYPEFKPENQDRVVILSDANGDGKFDERKVFLTKGHRFSGITLGFGGVWLCSPPRIIFIPDANGDDAPDGPEVVLLDGFSTNASHNMVNGLAWGPDGWLYGRHGILQNAFVGQPGTPQKDRVRLNCSIWRYHPTRKVFEVVAHGTTNPWGLDWDEHGQPFFSNNVIGHMWHLVPGAHYQRMYGEDFNPHYYALMKAASDHLHWAGSDWTRTRGGTGEHNALGGGHAHCGLMIYQGDNWPDEYRQTLMMANIHGNRLLLDRIHRQGSGYSAKHAGNFLMANDPWFRGVTMAYGPDGGVFVSDWNDLGECHDYDGSYRTSGRIYKITHGTTRTNAVDLARLSDAELVKLQLHRNEWFVRHARRLLQERHGAGKLDGAVRRQLQGIFETNPDVTRKLRALWALNVVDGINHGQLGKLLRHENEHIRWWALKLIADEDPEKFKSDLERMAEAEATSFVRLGIASALQRLKHEDRFSIAAMLLGHGEDSTDPNLPLMIWYALEPAIETHPRRGTELLKRCRMPLVRQFIARRLAAAYEVAKK